MCVYNITSGASGRRRARASEASENCHCASTERSPRAACAIWFRGGLVFEAHRLFVSLNSRLASNKQEKGSWGMDLGSLTCRNFGQGPGMGKWEGRTLWIPLAVDSRS